MCPSLIQIGSKTAEKNSAQRNRQTNKQTNRQTDRHYENNGHLAVNQQELTSSWVAEMGDRLATIDIGRKEGTAVPLSGELCLYLTQCGRDRGLPSCQISSWYVQPLGHSTPTSQTGQTGQRSDSMGRTAQKSRNSSLQYIIASVS